MEKTRSPEFKAKVTPEQVKEKLPNDKTKAGDHSEKAVKKTLPPADKKEPKKAAKKDGPLTFPVSARINDYGFIGLKKGLLEALGWHKGMGLKIERNSDGSVTMRKA